MIETFAIHDYAGFIAAILIFQLIPGPGTIAILNATARNGIGAGMGAVVGTLCGDLVYMLAAVFGLAAVMATEPMFFAALQWFGAGYLMWMGIQLLRTPVVASASEMPRQSGWQFFRQALAVSLTNPKVILFFVAFFPLFMRSDATPVTLGVMMAHVTLICLLYQTLLVLVGNAIAARVAKWSSARKVTTRLAGIALVGFGLRLAASPR
jgi:threonine/homoserine/homoserine lactone efflux protein